MQITVQQYIASQIIIAISYTCLGLTYCSKKRKIILALSFLANFTNACAYLLLGAYTSASMCAISIARDIVFIIDEKINGKSEKTTKKDVFILMGVYAVSAISIILTFNGWKSLLYAVASMLYTYSIWQKNNKVYRLMGILCHIIVIIESVAIKSIAGLILQSIVLICTIIMFIKSKNEEKRHKIKGVKI